MRQLNVFDSNISDLIYIPEDGDFRERLKEVTKTEVDKEILRIEEEISKL